MAKILPLIATITATVAGVNFTPDFEPGGPGDIFEPTLPGRTAIGFSLPGLSVPGFPSEDFSVPNLPSSSSLASSSSQIEVSDYFNCGQYGPFIYAEMSSNTQFTFTYELGSVVSQTAIERVRLFRNGEFLFGTSKASFTVMAGQRRTVDFLVPLRDYLNDTGLQMRFEIVSRSTYEVLREFSAYFYPPKYETRTISSLKSKVYSSRSVGFYGNGKKMCEIYELFDFRKIGDYIDNDYYYRLDISRNKFIYPNEYVFTYGSANLRFNDSENLFRYLTHQPNGDIVLPLTLVRDSNNNISFRYKNSFYVNKKSLEISDQYRQNFALTDDFYLPINGLKKFNGKTVYLELNELGMDKLSTVVPLRYELNRAIVGTCTDGEYCVIGGNK